MVALGDDVVEGLGVAQELEHAAVKAGEDRVSLAAALGRVCSCLDPAAPRKEFADIAACMSGGLHSLHDLA